MDLAKLVLLLTRRELILVNVRLLQDSHEASLTRAEKQHWDTVEQEQDLGDFRKRIGDTYYVSCWHANDDESEAMWQLYCGPNQGVAIQTTYEKLDASLGPDTSESTNDLTIGLVRYIDYDTRKKVDGNLLTRIMLKRRAFAHEREVRIVNWCHHLLDSDQTPPVTRFEWDPRSIIEQVCVNPYADEWYFDAVRTIVDRFAPELAGRLKWSRLRCQPLG